MAAYLPCQKRPPTYTAQKTANVPCQNATHSPAKKS